MLRSKRLRATDVSQLVVASQEPPLQEGSRDRARLELMHQIYRDPGVLDRPVSEVQCPPLPTVGFGEPVARWSSCSIKAPSASCSTVAARSVLTRSDVLAFLAAPRREPRATARGTKPGSTPARFTRANRRIPSPARSSHRSISRRRSRKKRCGKHGGFEYVAERQPDAQRRRKRASHRSKAPGNGLAFASGLAAEDAVLRRSTG